jgi:Integrase zinc binding domain
MIWRKHIRPIKKSDQSFHGSNKVPNNHLVIGGNQGVVGYVESSIRARWSAQTTLLRSRWFKLQTTNNHSEKVTLWLKIAHEGMTGGHLGYVKTADAIQMRGYWSTWKSDLKDFMKSCEPCSKYHKGSVKRQAPLQTPHLGEPWESVSIDNTGPHPRSSSGKVYMGWNLCAVLQKLWLNCAVWLSAA